MMSRGRRPVVLLIILLLLLVFSGGARTQEDQSWVEEPLWFRNFNQFMDMGRKAVEDFNQDRQDIVNKFVYCRTERVQKQTVGEDVFYALTFQAGQRACFTRFSFTCFGDINKVYEAVVVHRHGEQGFKLRSFISLPWYSPRYDNICV
ncbi:hypothetical protein AXF42_Ash015776 [Apostasia shenzhenica]|uniref:Cystatin domain-containing protein n=1 Tax=Apostasia shenzhenica TaxID=1088818 RepID=A0A2H9ZXL8_9ASPA|nr:hypothetical protein AXF42_Ash015776 [Apostasia shenzhenica]